MEKYYCCLPTPNPIARRVKRLGVRPSSVRPGPDDGVGPGGYNVFGSVGLGVVPRSGSAACSASGVGLEGPLQI